jgi:ankyrin repeat protein
MADSGSLIDAAEAGDLQTVRTLVADGADLQVRTGNGATVLHCAAAGGHRDVCELLLESGIDTNASDYDGRTILHFAAFGGNSDVIDLLLSRGAFVSAPDDADRRTPLHVAAMQGYVDAMNLLVAAGADVNERDGSGRTALWHAASSGHGEAMDVLLALGADVNATDDAGLSPLLAALVEDQTDAARLLLSMGASFAVREHQEGLSPLHVAAAHGKKNLVELLLNCGANADARSSSGASPADAAAAGGHTEIAEMLRRFVAAETLAIEEAGAAGPHAARPSRGEGDVDYAFPVMREADVASGGMEVEDIVPGLPEGFASEEMGTSGSGMEPSGVLRFSLEPEEEESTAGGYDRHDFSDLVEGLGESGAAPIPLQEEVFEAEPDLGGKPLPVTAKAPERVAPVAVTRVVRGRKPKRRWLNVFIAVAAGGLAAAVALIVPARLELPRGGGAAPEGERAVLSPTGAVVAKPSPKTVKTVHQAPAARARIGPAGTPPASRRAPAEPKAPILVTATIVSRPPGATAVIDNGERSGKTPLVVVLRPGAHQVYVSMPGYRPESEVLQIGSEPMKVVVELQPLLD